MMIGRQCRQSPILHRAADGEVIERLEPQALHCHNLMHRVIEETPNPGRPHSRCLRFQVEHLPEYTRLPEETWIPPRSLLPQASLELSQHAKRKCAVSRNLLMAADLPSQPPRIAFKQPIERQIVRCSWCHRPIHLRIHRFLNESKFPRITDKKIKPRCETTHTMDEQHQMNRRIVGPGIPRHGSFQLRTFDPWHHSLHHPEERGRRDRGFSIEGDRAPALPDDLSCRWAFVERDA